MPVLKGSGLHAVKGLKGNYHEKEIRPAVPW